MAMSHKARSTNQQRQLRSRQSRSTNKLLSHINHDFFFCLYRNSLPEENNSMVMAEQETTGTNPRHFWGILCCGLKANNSVQPANPEKDEKPSYVQNPSVSSSFVSTRSVHRSSQDPGSNKLGEGTHSHFVTYAVSK